MIERPHEAAFREVETPVCGPGDVLVRSRLAGVCRTDFEVLNGELDRRWVRYPCIPGHEWSGVVEAVGEGVPDVDPGDRVVCEGFCYCGACRRCRAGDTHLCEHYDCLGFTRGGGYGELVLVPRRVVHRLPESVPLDAAVLIEPASVVLKGLLRARPQPRETVGVIGVGTLGALAIVLARLFSPTRSSPTGSASPSWSLRGGSAPTRPSTSPAAAPRTRASSIWSSRPPAPSRPSSSRPACRARAAGSSGSGSPGEGRELCVPADRFVLRDLELIGSVGYTTCGLEPCGRAAWRRPCRLRADRRPARPGRAVRGRLRADGGAGRRRRENPARARGGVTDRTELLRRAGVGAAGVSLAQLLGPAAAPWPETVAATSPRIRAGGSSSSATTRSTRCSSRRSSARRTRRRSCSARCSGRALRGAT